MTLKTEVILYKQKFWRLEYLHVVCLIICIWQEFNLVKCMSNKVESHVLSNRVDSYMAYHLQRCIDAYLIRGRSRIF